MASTTTTTTTAVSSTEDVLLYFLAIFIPPLSVWIRCGCHAEFWINFLLSILGWIPGVLHAWWVISKSERTVVVVAAPIVAPVAAPAPAPAPMPPPAPAPVPAPVVPPAA